MHAWLRQLALCFAAGAAGGAAKSLAAWTAARLGMRILIGAHGATALAPAHLYPRVVWGGLWGILFLLPLLRRSVLVGGLVAGVIVTLVQRVALPLWWHGSLELALLPLLDTLLLNLVWGLVAGALLKWL